MDAPQEITCSECGGTGRLLSSPPPDEGFAVGDIVAYVCIDCGHRMDIVLDDDREEPAG